MPCPVHCAAWSASGMMRCRPGTRESAAGMGPGSAPGHERLEPVFTTTHSRHRPPCALLRTWAGDTNSRAISSTLLCRANHFRFSEKMSSPQSKNKSLPISANQNYKSRRLIPEGGASAVVTERRDGMRWTQQHGARQMSQGEMNLVSDGRRAGRAMLQRLGRDFGRQGKACREID
jgi:hypothetical protein